MLIEDDIKTSAWTHYAYEKIVEGIDIINLSVDDFRKLNRFEWVVTEKIHKFDLKYGDDVSGK